MKKLMIAAAFAAMVGGVQAYDTVYVYDFTATLTTTKGAEGKGTWSKNYTVNLGKDDVGNWWYDDAIFTDTGDNYKSVELDGETYPKALKYGNKQYPWKVNTSVIKDEEVKQALAEALGYDPVTGETAYNVQQDYRNKKVWCETFKFKVYTPAECYRAKGTQKISTNVEFRNACNDGVILLDDKQYAFTEKFLNFFGSADVLKATSVEALFTFDSENVGDAGLTADEMGDNFGFALAGQGTWKDKLATVKIEGVNETFAGIDSISGNIVGYLPAPDCEACCADEAPAKAFMCDEDPNDRVESWSLPTAAFGTWSMKFNKKATFGL